MKRSVAIFSFVLALTGCGSASYTQMGISGKPVVQRAVNVTPGSSDVVEVVDPSADFRYCMEMIKNDPRFVGVDRIMFCRSGGVGGQYFPGGASFVGANGQSLMTYGPPGPGTLAPGAYAPAPGAAAPTGDDAAATKKDVKALGKAHVELAKKVCGLAKDCK